jgi:hypothetical protein
MAHQVAGYSIPARAAPSSTITLTLLLYLQLSLPEFAISAYRTLTVLATLMDDVL